jgi:hypothetical protein
MQQQINQDLGEDVAQIINHPCVLRHKGNSMDSTDPNECKLISIAELLAAANIDEEQVHPAVYNARVFALQVFTQAMEQLADLGIAAATIIERVLTFYGMELDHELIGEAGRMRQATIDAEDDAEEDAEEDEDRDEGNEEEGDGSPIRDQSAAISGVRQESPAVRETPQPIESTTQKPSNDAIDLAATGYPTLKWSGPICPLCDAGSLNNQVCPQGTALPGATEALTNPIANTMKTTYCPLIVMDDPGVHRSTWSPVVASWNPDYGDMLEGADNELTTAATMKIMFCLYGIADVTLRCEYGFSNREIVDVICQTLQAQESVPAYRSLEVIEVEDGKLISFHLGMSKISHYP